MKVSVIKNIKLDDNNQLNGLEIDGVKYITTAQLAKLYGVTTDAITKNFNRNKQHFIENIDYIYLSGERFAELKSELIKSAQKTNGQFVRQSDNLMGSNARAVNLWTESGVLNHVKIIKTEQAWAHFNQLKKFFFNHREEHPNEVIDPTSPEAVFVLAKAVLDYREEITRLKKEVSDKKTLLNEKSHHEKTWTSYFHFNEPGAFEKVVAWFENNNYVSRRYLINPKTGKLKQYGYRIIPGIGDRIFDYYGGNREEYSIWGIKATAEIREVLPEHLKKYLITDTE
ncbi:ORF6N domain-containing protein [Enterobacter kobei]|uniref:ORF6N domain-containing protein n=1 Tax=Enterobacter kobei TaxID=208224 RepID=UPI0020222BD3|nr:ORF6N domain-containing protein [Enterobacter kobei]MCL8167114.1 ORF6N domain-containing protein [Enterobacter kobei]MCM7795610.1 ORF6N domain-containing protein [Enterobacter kobei]